MRVYFSGRDVTVVFWLNLISTCLFFNLYNRYTNGDKIPIESILEKIDIIIEKLVESARGGAIRNLLTGLRGNDEGNIFTFLEDLKK